MPSAIPYPTLPDWLALVAIADHLQNHHRAPTLGELAAYLQHTNTSTARAHVLRLTRLGLLTLRRTPRGGIAPRTLSLTPAGQTALHTHRAMQQANLLRGTHELALTPTQLQHARAADLPIDSFPQRHHRGRTILRCLNWHERNYWGEKILYLENIETLEHA